MSAVAVQAAPQAAEASVSALGRQLVRWLRKNIPAVIISTAIGFAVGFLTQTYFIAVINQGLNGYQNGTDASPHPSSFALAFLISGVATTVCFGVFGYLFAVGPKRFAADVRQLPGSLVSLFTRDGNAGRVHLLWGAAASLVATTLISPAVGAMLAVGLLASAPGVLGRTLSTLMMRVWSQVLQRVAPTRKVRPPGVVSMSVGVLGASAAMLISYILPAGATIGGAAGYAGGPGGGGVPTRLVIAVGFAVLAFALSRTSPAAGAAVRFLIVAAGVATMYEILHPLLAHATDGGFAECGNPDIARYLLQCQGSAGVAAVAAAGGAGGGAGAAAGLALGQIAAQGGANDMGGPPDAPPQIPPKPTVPAFPHVFMRGNQLIIECANGVQLRATVNPDGSTGPWSATNLNTQSGGAIENQVTGADGSVTTNYTDGSSVVKGADGSVQTWAPGEDGTTYTLASPDGTVTTTHPDNSVDVRSPDGTIATTYPGGRTVTQYPDGSSVETNGGTTITHNADGTVDATLPNGSTQHQSSDGTVVSTDRFGNETVVNPDGTVIVTNQDGTSATKWPDGSWEATAADGTKTIHNADGTTYVHNPDDQGVVTYNADGSRETRLPDGTVSVRDPHGAVTTWSTDGSVGTTYPNGMVVSYDPHGNMNVSLPNGQDLGDPNAALHNLDDQSGYLRGRPDAYAAVAQLQQQVAANGGQWTPDLLSTLVSLQAQMGQISNQQDKAIDLQQQQLANQAMEDKLRRLYSEADTKFQDASGNMVSVQSQIQAQIDRQQEYIRNHLSDLPVSQWQGVEDALHTINSRSPNAQDIAYLQNISHSMFIQNQGMDTSGRQLGQAIGQVLQPPHEPQPMPTDVTSLVMNQRDFLINHVGSLPDAQRQFVQNLIDRNFGDTAPTMRDLQDFQKASHAVFNSIEGKSESVAAQATIDALNHEATAVAIQRVDQLAKGTGMVLSLPLAASGGLAALGFRAAGAGVGMAAGEASTLQVAGNWLATGVQALAVPGAAEAGAATVVSMTQFVSGAMSGGIGGYFGEGGHGSGAHGVLWGVAAATLPVNTINAVVSGEGAGKIAMSVFQDVGNVKTGIDVGHKLDAAAGFSAGVDRLLNPPIPLSAAELADRTQGMRAAAELGDLHATAAKDPEFTILQNKLQSANDQLDLFGKHPDPAVRAQLAEDVTQARAALDANPMQQQMRATANNLLDNYQGRAFLKNAPVEVQQAYSDQVNLMSDDVRARALQAANAAGITRGGQPMTQDDLVFLRNKGNNSAPMDNDVALNEMRQRQLQDYIAHPPEGTSPDQLQRLQGQLTKMQAAQQPMINGKPVSNAEWNDQMQKIWNKSFTDTTGRDPHLAMQEVTQRYHPEAYPDLNALQKDVKNYPLNPAHAESTGDVTSYKATQNEKLFNGPDVAPADRQPWNAVQETARGTAKDIETKLLPLLEAKYADPAKIAQVKEMQQFLKDVGTGRYGLDQANAMARDTFGAPTGISDLNLRTSAALTTATKWQAPSSPPVDLGTAVQKFQKVYGTEQKLEKMHTTQAANDAVDEKMRNQ